MRPRLFTLTLLCVVSCSACKPPEPPVPTSTTRVLASDDRGMWVARASKKQPGTEDVLYCVKPAKLGESPRCWPAKIEKGKLPAFGAALTKGVACTAVPCTAVPCTAVPCTSGIAPAGSGAPTSTAEADPRRSAPAALVKAIKQLGPTKWSVERAAIRQSMFMRGARIVPSIRNGKPNGFKLFAIRPGTICRLLGLQNGDTVHAINGLALASPSAALDAVKKVGKARKLTVELTRRGQPLTHHYILR